MRFTTFTDYAFRVLIVLALVPERRTTINDIAGQYDISKNHLMKVVNQLTRAEIVMASRGPNGGLTLARPPGDITVGEIVRLTEESFMLTECFRPDDQCVITPACTLKLIFGESLAAFFEVLDSYSILDLVKQEAGLKRLLV